MRAAGGGGGGCDKKFFRFDQVGARSVGGDELWRELYLESWKKALKRRKTPTKCEICPTGSQSTEMITFLSFFEVFWWYLGRLKELYLYILTELITKVPWTLIKRFLENFENLTIFWPFLTDNRNPEWPKSAKIGFFGGYLGRLKKL